MDERNEVFWTQREREDVDCLKKKLTRGIRNEKRKNNE